MKMTTYPWDDVPHFSPEWAEISGKANMYKTAYRRSDGKCLALLGVSRFNPWGDPATGPAYAEAAGMLRAEAEQTLKAIAENQLFQYGAECEL